MANLKLTLACGEYDRTRPLRDGKVVPEGIDLTYLPISPPNEIFYRMMQFEEFDMSEMSFSNYLSERCKDNYRFVAIPVFPSKKFRHSFIFINKNSGIKSPSDLKGKKVGIPHYGKTATVWIRGILQHEYGVAPADMDWYEGSWEEVGTGENIKVKLPEDVHIQSTKRGKTLSDMLADGDIDALVTVSVPQSFTRKNPNIDRLFPNYREVETAYYQKTKIYPIMHTMVIKRKVYEANPWVAVSMFKAFSQSKKMGLEAMTGHGGLFSALPWFANEWEATLRLMGEDFFAYGIEANRKTVETFAGYSFEQGLSTRQLTIEEIFVPNVI